MDNPNQVGLEIPVDGFDPQAWAALKVKLDRVKESGGTYHANLPTGISDYVLYRSNGEILAIVEAKRTSVDPRLAQTQAEFYVTELEKRQSFRPFAFMTNGKDIYFLDAGNENKRPVAGFFSPSDLENLLSLRQNKIPLPLVSINTSIVDRIYQQEAIRRVCETFEQQHKRKALLVMATGTGKTRTVMALIDLFMRANQARRILFVADRDALVQQALTDGFQKFLPNEPCQRITTHKLEQSSRLYTATLQTLNLCFQSFTPGFFDLIIFDEAHRSIFNKWNEVLQYFDGRIIGLTATPADFIDRNTFLTFDCSNMQPTYLYPYRQAVQEGYLVDYAVFQARTKFQREGIKGIDLNEEDRNALYEQGIDPDDLDFTGTDLERNVSNKDTLRRQWQEIWDECYKDESGQIPGKTIVFAMTQKHALRLEETFNEMFPQYPNMVRVITSKSDHKGNSIRQFREEEYPRIAITVDLLETGIDVPEVVNLAFMKPVQSRIKLEQMIGRGTRSQAACRYLNRLPNREKKQFLIIDFWENNFNKSASEELRQSLPVFVALFNTRINLLERYLESGKHEAEKNHIIERLREQISRIPADSFSVKKFEEDLEEVQQDFFWQYLTKHKLDLLKRKIAPLLRYVPAVNVEVTTFTHKVERLKLQLFTGKEWQTTAILIADDVSRLPNFIVQDQRYKPAIDLCLAPQRLLVSSAEKLDEVIDLLAPQMNKRREKANTFIKLDLPDYIDMHGYIFLKGGSERVYVEEYRRRVDEHILQLIDTHPTLEAITQDKEVSDQQLLELERTLHKDLGQGEVELTEEHIRMAYGMKIGSLIEFVRNLLELDGIPDYNDIVRRQFKGYTTQHIFNSDQLRFLSALENFFLQKRRLHRVDLYQEPFTRFGVDAVERLFTKEQIDDLINFTNSLAA
ncbi:type I restriction endonuclease subunit R [Dictyobacter kobayashii]|uniref:Type I restriction-modification system restriction subunit n=1 Tax=Dictyobacter kobayashii TaxID=2014872 RepID=A0A402ACB6_9CHLR|nr:DEAD/DEAH box helicase family protein [Dictyobacter kobayashii]GCE16752.1 type I restriction-modification system restriction subunit [Dictyobacter kobayashii]